MKKLNSIYNLNKIVRMFEFFQPFLNLILNILYSIDIVLKKIFPNVYKNLKNKCFQLKFI